MGPIQPTEPQLRQNPVPTRRPASSTHRHPLGSCLSREAYQDAGRTYPATLELVSTVSDGNKVVRTRLRIQRMPGYVEAVLLDKFLRKLKDEYGAPPPPQPVVDPFTGPAGEAKAKPAGGGSGNADEDVDEDDLEIDEDELEDATKE